VPTALAQPSQVLFIQKGGKLNTLQNCLRNKYAGVLFCKSNNSFKERKERKD